MKPLVGYLANLEVEYPELCDIARYDPPIIKPWVDKWELFYNTNITTEYVKRRGWKLFHAVRELIQDVLDEQEVVYGFDATFDAKIWLDDAGLHLRDYGRGITLDAFRVGGTDKECWQRGYFGEGLKVAAGWFAMQGDLLYAIARDKIYKAVLFGDTVVIIIGKSTRHFEGTQFTICGPDVVNAERVAEGVTYQTFVKAHGLRPIGEMNVKFGDCPRARRCFILDNPTDYLWVGDIFVNYISKVANKKAVFSYNVWGVPLEPNRVMITDIDRFKTVIATVWHPMGDKQYDMLLDRILDDRGTIVIKVKDVFEVDALSGTNHSISYSIAEDNREKIAEAVKRKYGDSIVRVDEEAKLEWFSYLLPGYTFLVTPTYEARELFRKVEKAELELMRTSIEREREANESTISYESLSLGENRVLAEGNYLLYKLHLDLLYGKPQYPVFVSDAILDAEGMHQGGKIYILRDSLKSRWEFIDTFTEEVSHLIGTIKYGEARDVSRQFENAMREVSTEMYRLALQPSNHDKLDSIYRGLYPVWSDKPFDHVDKIKSVKYILDAFQTVTYNEVKELLKKEEVEIDTEEIYSAVKKGVDIVAPVTVSSFIVSPRARVLSLWGVRVIKFSEILSFPVKELQGIVNRGAYDLLTSLRDELSSQIREGVVGIVVAAVWDFREYKPFILTSEVISR